MKKIIFLGVLLLSMVTYAQKKNSKFEIEVDGVCNSCKARIEKAALGVKGVKMAQWDTASHLLFFIFDERKTQPIQIQKAIAKKGHDNRLPDGKQEIIATDQDYEAIADCCHYRDEKTTNHH